jgi:hypothetical protein
MIFTLWGKVDTLLTIAFRTRAMECQSAVNINSTCNSITALDVHFLLNKKD